MNEKNNFNFEISLSILNHLGRNLYRGFSTILGEAISNSWDADANNVMLYISKEKNSFIVIDDGVGMDENDFQNKFLKIGYSKRKKGESNSSKGRPFIGRKGIGKLALLSCAEKITIISKKESMESHIGGIINNTKLDEAINNDITPQEYPLENLELTNINELIDLNKHKKGTIILFEGLNESIKNNIPFLRKIIALYFRFSLIDDSFNIFLNEEIITVEDLEQLGNKTQFLWRLNELEDPYLDNKLSFLLEDTTISTKNEINGFICSVDKPTSLNILGVGEKVSIDLFVNGRIREKNILRHIPSSRIVESYLYGQIHFNILDSDDNDRFTSSREGVKSEDPFFNELLRELKENIIPKIIKQWDILRIKHKSDGDSENNRIPKKERKSGELFNSIIENDYSSNNFTYSKENQTKVNKWIENLEGDAKFNFMSYAECYISENLIRNYIKERDIKLTDKYKKEIQKWQITEIENKKKANIRINIRKSCILSYLGMDLLSELADSSILRDSPHDLKEFVDDSKKYKPIRDALMHTSQLSDEAKKKLSSTYDNIKGRVIDLIHDD